MLKTFILNKIYEEVETGNLYYVRKVKKVKNRNKFLLRKVNKNGSLGAKKECFFKRIDWKLRDDYMDKVYIIKTEESKKTRFQLDQEKRYKDLVMKTRRLIAEERIRMREESSKFYSDNFKYAIAQYAFCACSYVDYSKDKKNKSTYKTVRQFARDIGMNNTSKYYDWLNHFYKSRYPQDVGKLRKHLDKMADRTLVQCRMGLERKWHSLHGFSKSLDRTIETFRDVYESLIFERGIYLDESK